MLPFIITKYISSLTIFTILLAAETDAQLFNLNVLSFNNNRAGNNSLNNNGNALASSSTGRSPGFQTQANPFGSWFSAISNGLSYLLGGSSANNFGYPYSFGYLGYTERNPLPRGNNWYSGGSLYNYYGFTPYYYPSYQNYYSLFRG